MEKFYFVVGNRTHDGWSSQTRLISCSMLLFWLDTGLLCTERFVAQLSSQQTHNSILWTILYCTFILKSLNAAELILSSAVKKQSNQCCSMLIFATVETAEQVQPEHCSISS